MTIRRRLSLWYSGLLALIIVIFSIAVITVSRLTFLQTVDQVLDGALAEVTENLQLVPTSDSAQAVEIYFSSDSIFKVPGISVQIWRTHERGEQIDPVLTHASADVGDLQLPIDQSIVSLPHREHTTTTINNVPARVVGQPITDDGDIIGTILLATPLRSVESANDMLLIIIVIGASFSLLVSIGLGLWLSERALKPVKEITVAANNIANTSDLSTRLEWQGTMDEMGELVNVFNQMMARLELLFQIQQRFIGDVSHELRTPLTSILGNVEIMERYGVDDDSLESIHRAADRMKRMVDDLLLLTRADSGEMIVDLYPIDLETIVLDVYQQAQKFAQEKAIEAKLGRFEPVRIEGNADRLRQLMMNIVQNAVKFTSEGGQITLSVYAENDEAIIDVQDTGIGIAEEDLQRVFDRFFQADSARVHHSEADGAGLGLSIASWIVDIHGGSISVHSELGEGTLFRTRIPFATHNTHGDIPPTDNDAGKTSSAWIRTKPPKAPNHSTHLDFTSIHKTDFPTN